MSITYLEAIREAQAKHGLFEIHPGNAGEKPPVDPFATLLAFCDDNLPKAKPAPN